MWVELDVHSIDLRCQESAPDDSDMQASDSGDCDGSEDEDCRTKRHKADANKRTNTRRAASLRDCHFVEPTGDIGC